MDKGLTQFMKEHAQDPKAEYYIPSPTIDLIESKTLAIEVIPTNDNCLALPTKKMPMAVAAIEDQINEDLSIKSESKLCFYDLTFANLHGF